MFCFNPHEADLAKTGTEQRQMSDTLHILTYEHGKAAVSATALIRVEMIDGLLAPFVVTRQATDDRSVEFTLAFDEADSVQISVTLKDDDAAFATSVAIQSWSADPVLAEAVHAMLADANAVLVLDGDTPPVVGRRQTIAHLPPDLIAALGMPYLAEDGATLFACEAIATSRPIKPVHDVPHPDQIAYWRQLQVRDQYRDRVFYFAESDAMMMRAIVRRATDDAEPPQIVQQLTTYLGFVEDEVEATRDRSSDSWTERAGLAHGKVIDFGLVARIDSGRLVTRMGPRLMELDTHRAYRTRDLVQAEHEDRQAQEMSAGLLARGLETTPSATEVPPEPPTLSDARLHAALARQEELVLDAHRKLWQQVKGMTDQMPSVLALASAVNDDTALVLNLSSRLEALRKAARADTLPDWCERVMSALAVVDAPAIHQKLLAKASLKEHDRVVMAILYCLELQLPRLLRAAEATKARRDLLQTELRARGLGQPGPKRPERGA